MMSISKRSGVMSFFYAACLFLLLAISANTASADAAGAKQFIEGVGKSTLTLIADKSVNQQDKQQKLESLFLDVVDTDWIGKFALGKYWRTATEDQKTHYTELYRKFLVTSYVPRFKEYTNESFNVTGVREDGNREFLVQTEILRPGQASILVDYRVKEESGKYRIFDIVGEGVSLITTQRSEFGAVVAREGMDKLLEKLQARVDQMAQMKSSAV